MTNSDPEGQIFLFPSSQYITFSPETTSEEFDSRALKIFLEGHGVYNQGMWRRECQLWRKSGQKSQFGKKEITSVFQWQYIK